MKILKATAISPANIAFIKYWGQKDAKLILPFNNSISMNLDNCLTTTTVAFSDQFREDSVRIKFYNSAEKEVDGKQKERVITQVNRSREQIGIKLPAKIVSHNSFPADAGIASSASAFSALTLALVTALGIKVNKRELSIFTRLGGSGSATRSVYDGFVEWQAGKDSQSSYAVQLHDEKWWDLADIVAVGKDDQKKVSSLDGHLIATTSPYFAARQTELPQRTRGIKEALITKDFLKLGRLIEAEAVSLHLVAMSSQPPIFYWNEGTMQIVQALLAWREKGLLGFFTMDAGPNVHVICRRQEASQLNKRLRQLSSVKFTIINRPAKGARLVKKHLF